MTKLVPTSSIWHRSENNVRHVVAWVEQVVFELHRRHPAFSLKQTLENREEGTQFERQRSVVVGMTMNLGAIEFQLVQ